MATRVERHRFRHHGYNLIRYFDLHVLQSYIRMINWELHRTPFMKKSNRVDIKNPMPKIMDVDEWVSHLQSAMRKASTIEEKRKLKIMIDEFKDLREML